jgi:cytoplasmic iron level regulating protein YaaA (DUF328/UPF0246 family)
MPRVSTKLPLILLPPSEGKAIGGDAPLWSPGSMAIDLDTERRVVLKALARTMADDETSRRKLLGVAGSNLERATEANRTAARAPTMQAIERYTGVLYDALDHASLSATERRRLNASVVIFSGLWGLVMPRDPIPDYRLKMGATLAPMGTLSRWWRQPLTHRLLHLAGTRAVWNLLPSEHASSWAPPRDFPQWTVRFVDRRSDGSLSAVSHDNKSLKGALVRHLVAHPDTTPADLRTWKHPAGYHYSPKATEHRGGVTIVSMIRG